MFMGKPLVFADAESFSEAPLVKNKTFTGHNSSCGAHIYAMHPSTEALMWSYQDDIDGDPQLWDCTDPDTPDMPEDLHEMLMACVRGDAWFVAWNGIMFDRLILKHVHGIDIPAAHCIDLMYLARLANLPASLEKCGIVLGLPDDKAKLKTGKALINLFTKPAKRTRKKVVTWVRNNRYTHPEKWAEFCGYGLQDTVALAAIWKKIPKVNWTGARGDFERRLIVADTAINDRGVRVDLVLAKAAKEAGELHAATMAEDAMDAYGINVASNEQFLEHLAELWPSRAIQTSGKGAAAKGTLNELLRDPDIPDEARDLIEDRMDVTSKGGGKFTPLIVGCGDGDRYYGAWEYGKAQQTMRWTGSRAGLMNVSRGHYHDGDEGVWPGDEQELTRAIKLLKKGRRRFRRYDVPKLTASVTRACLIPDAGDDCLQVCDFSNIEGRLAFALAGGLHGVQKFIDADNGGDGVYEKAAAGMFGIPVVDVHKEQRQIGKLVSLSSQYGSAVAGFVQFAAGYGFDVAAMCKRLAGTLPADVWARSASAYEFCKQMRMNMAKLDRKQWRIVWCLIQMWRADAERDAGLVSLWDELNSKAIAAVQRPGTSQWAGARVRRDGKKAFRFEVPVDGRGKPRPWLYMELPSKRIVMFAHPELKRSRSIEDGEDPDKHTGRINIHYKAPSDKTGVWTTQRLYGGKLLAIGTQSTARDFQAEAIVRVHEDKQKIVLHVHDEIGTSHNTLKNSYNLKDRMCIVPEWFAEWFPLTGSSDLMPVYSK